MPGVLTLPYFMCLILYHLMSVCCVLKWGFMVQDVKLRWSFHLLLIQKGPSLIQIGKEVSDATTWTSWNFHHLKTCVENTPTRQSFKCHFSFWSFQTSKNSRIWWNSPDYCLICSQFLISLSFCTEQLVIITKYCSLQLRYFLTLKHPFAISTWKFFAIRVFRNALLNLLSMVPVMMGLDQWMEMIW